MAIKPQRESLDDKIKRLTSQKIPTISKTTIKKKQSLKGFFGLLSKLTPEKWSKQLDIELHRSGIPISGGEYIIMQLFLLVFFTLVALPLSSVNILVVFLPLLGLILPRFYITNAQNKKSQKFNNQLPDVLLVLGNSLKAGFSLFQAMEMAAQEMPDPISTELKTTLKEMTYGASTESALQNLSERIKSKDMDLMVTAILIQRQIGGNLSEILMGIHETINERIKIQGEIKSLTAQGRLSGYIIGFVPFGIALAVTAIQPDYLKVFFNSTLGIALISMGLCSQFIGFLLIRKIVDIKV